MTSLAGKHVLLTGGSRGLGPVIAESPWLPVLLRG
jgi:NAD(P)-dependent dehydrogenase (short-subunit alcohol dehydrogenase family)